MTAIFRNPTVAAHTNETIDAVHALRRLVLAADRPDEGQTARALALFDTLETFVAHEPNAHRLCEMMLHPVAA
jgi:hypothetical protein